jgi:DNA-binding beta-propeller fold protein YncE
MKRVLLLLVVFILIVSIPLIHIGNSPAWSTDWGSVDYQSGQLSITTSHKSVLLLRQGGKLLHRQVITQLTAEIDLEKILKEGQFQVRLVPISFKRSKSVGKQGTNLGDFLDPRGVAVDSLGRIIVADMGNDRIQVFAADFVPRFEFGGFNWREQDTSFNTITDSARGSFNVPTDIAVNIKDIFVSERENNRIQKFDMDGNFLLSFGGSGDERGQISYPMGICCDRLGNVYVADSRNDRVQKFDVNGNFILEIGGFGYTEGRMNAPSDVTVDIDERIHVLDKGNSRIQIFDRFGHFLKEFPLEKTHGYDSLVVLYDAVIAVTDSRKNRILLYGEDGDILDVIGNLKRPRGISMTEKGDIIVMEAGIPGLTRLSAVATFLEWEFEK